MVNYYSYEVKLRKCERLTDAGLQETIRSILTDDELLFRPEIPLHIIFTEGTNVNQLTDDVKKLSGNGSESGYLWNHVEVVSGDKYPEVHVVLKQIV